MRNFEILSDKYSVTESGRSYRKGDDPSTTDDDRVTTTCNIFTLASNTEFLTRVVFDPVGIYGLSQRPYPQTKSHFIVAS